MISDERLHEIIEDCGALDGYADFAEMAKELLAHRKAWSEPAAYEVKGLLCHTLEEAEIYVGEPEPLYRKPDTGEV